MYTHVYMYIYIYIMRWNSVGAKYYTPEIAQVRFHWNQVYVVKRSNSKHRNPYRT